MTRNVDFLDYRCSTNPIAVLAGGTFARIAQQVQQVQYPAAAIHESKRLAKSPRGVVRHEPSVFRLADDAPSLLVVNNGCAYLQDMHQRKIGWTEATHASIAKARTIGRASRVAK